MTERIATVCQNCPTCEGTGRVPLIPSLREALDMLSNHGAYTPPELALMIGVSATAANNRLERLRSLGLVTRERVTRGHSYTIAKGKVRHAHE